MLDRLADHRTEVDGTDVHGTVVVTTDGVDIEVATERTEAPAPGDEAADDGGSQDSDDADTDALEGITRIGPDRAEEIVRMRPFTSVDSLTRIDGLGPFRIDDILDEGVACVP